MTLIPPDTFFSSHTRAKVTCGDKRKDQRVPQTKVDIIQTSISDVLLKTKTKQNGEVDLQRSSFKNVCKLDFQVYELANRFDFTIVQPPSLIGGYFEIKLAESKYSEFQRQLESLPNFELTDKPNGL